MEAVHFFQKLVSIHQTAWHHVPEDRIFLNKILHAQQFLSVCHVLTVSAVHYIYIVHTVHYIHTSPYYPQIVHL